MKGYSLARKAVINTQRIHGTGICTYIYHKKSTIHVGKYTSPMDPMGYTSRFKCLIINQHTVIVMLPRTCYWIKLLLPKVCSPTINIVGLGATSLILRASPIVLIFPIKVCNPKKNKGLTIGWAEVTISPTPINVYINIYIYMFKCQALKFTI